MEAAAWRLDQDQDSSGRPRDHASCSKSSVHFRRRVMKVQEQLDALKADVQKLKAKAGAARKEFRTRLAQDVGKLRERLRSAEKKLAGLKAARKGRSQQPPR
jgi:hypothetical protein